MPSAAPDMTPCISENELSFSFSALRVLSECSLDCFKNPDVVSSICCVDTTMEENAWIVPAAALKSAEVLSRFVISVAAIDSAPSCSAVSATACMAVMAVSDMVSINTSFTCVCTALAPLSVTLGAIAFSLALE